MFFQNLCMILLLTVHYCADTVTCVTDYCSLCPDGTHTLCKFKTAPGEACIGYGTINLTDQIKKDIVDMHNEIRSIVALGKEKRGNPGPQPKAANMKKMKWDEELQEIAQRWTDQCMTQYKLQHDICRDSERFQVGQNVVGMMLTNTDFPDVKPLIKEWYEEIDFVSEENIKSFSSRNANFKEIGSYSQMLWADTEYVGCGYSYFKPYKGNSNYADYYVHQMVCNYGPKGNIVNRPLYHIGEPCSECAECDTHYPGLCKDPNTPDDKEVSSHFYSDFPTLIGKSADKIPDQTEDKTNVPESTQVSETTKEQDTSPVNDSKKHDTTNDTYRSVMVPQGRAMVHFRSSTENILDQHKQRSITRIPVKKESDPDIIVIEEGTDEAVEDDLTRSYHHKSGSHRSGVHSVGPCEMNKSMKRAPENFYKFYERQYQNDSGDYLRKMMERLVETTAETDVVTVNDAAVVSTLATTTESTTSAAPTTAKYHSSVTPLPRPRTPPPPPPPPPPPERNIVATPSVPKEYGSPEQVGARTICNCSINTGECVISKRKRAMCMRRAEMDQIIYSEVARAIHQKVNREKIKVESNEGKPCYCVITNTSGHYDFQNATVYSIFLFIIVSLY